MAVLGIDKTPPWNKCDKDLVEKHKLDSLLHKAVANGKATGTTFSELSTLLGSGSEIQSCSILNDISVISSEFINKFVQKCQCYYTFSD